MLKEELIRQAVALGPSNSFSVKVYFNHLKPSFIPLLISIFVLIFAAALTTAYTGLLEIGSNHFGFPLAWKTIVSQEYVFQVFGFIIDIIFWTASYSSVLARISILLRRFKRNSK